MPCSDIFTAIFLSLYPADEMDVPSVSFLPILLPYLLVQTARTEVRLFFLMTNGGDGSGWCLWQHLTLGHICQKKIVSQRFSQGGQQITTPSHPGPWGWDPTYPSFGSQSIKLRSDQLSGKKLQFDHHAPPENLWSNHPKTPSEGKKKEMKKEKKRKRIFLRFYKGSDFFLQSYGIIRDKKKPAWRPGLAPGWRPVGCSSKCPKRCARRTAAVPHQPGP